MKNRFILSISLVALGVASSGLAADRAYACRVARMKTLQDLDPRSLGQFEVPSSSFPSPVHIVGDVTAFCRHFPSSGATEGSVDCLFQQGLPGQPRFAVLAEVTTSPQADRIFLRNVLIQGKSYGILCNKKE